jgi:AraC family transcriptional regulator of adaptative response/methylated-DNA-[protein]-cysteine methyltransferase
MQENANLVEQDPRWAYVTARAATADVSFVYAVRTTGIYCRVGCPSRRPLARNVTFFDTPALAEMQGYRACRRCCPQQARFSGEDPCP